MSGNKDVLARMPPFAPPSGRGLTKVHVRYFGENPMGTCVCSQERAEGSQNATARPSGRQLHHTPKKSSFLNTKYVAQLVLLSV